MPPNNQKKEMWCAAYHLGNGEKTTCYLGKTILQHIEEFVEMGLCTSRSEFVRGALYEKIVKTIQENEMIQEWQKMTAFNNSQDKAVLVPGAGGNYKKYNIVRRLE